MTFDEKIACEIENVVQIQSDSETLMYKRNVHSSLSELMKSLKPNLVKPYIFLQFCLRKYVQR